MFGYVRPVLNRLNEEEKKRYKSAYCGLCHAMGKRHGWLSRFTLNYDFAFLAILLYRSADEQSTQCLRCPAHLLKKPRECICGKTMDLVADESMILTWYKLTDDVEDKSLLPGLPARCLRWLLSGAYRRAAFARPEFDRRVKLQLGRLRELEAVCSPQLDRTADAFASILASAAGDCGGDTVRMRAMEQLLYHLGRWIYLMDAWDDLDEDVKKGRYNPLDARFQGKARMERDYVEATVTHSARLIGAAANLIEFGCWRTIVDNMIYDGLPAVQNAVLEGRWKELQTAREKRK